MCFELDSLPPVPCIAGAAVSHEDLVLESADGTRFAAFAAPPDEPAATASSSCPTSAGCTASTRSWRCGSPSAAIAAVAIDYFGRTAGVGKRDDDFPYIEHVAQTTPEGIQADVAAAVAYLRSPRAARASGLHRRLLLRRPPLLARRRRRARPGRRRRLLRHPRRAQRPARADPARRRDRARRSWRSWPATTTTSPPRTSRRSTQALTAAGVEHEIVTYAGAPHSFFDRRQDEYAGASADAWPRMLAFIGAHA